MCSSCWFIKFTLNKLEWAKLNDVVFLLDYEEGWLGTKRCAGSRINSWSHVPYGSDGSYFSWPSWRGSWQVSRVLSFIWSFFTSCRNDKLFVLIFHVSLYFINDHFNVSFKFRCVKMAIVHDIAEGENASCEPFCLS